MASGIQVTHHSQPFLENKKTPQEFLLETSKFNTRGTTQIAAKAAASDSNKSYPLTRADGQAWRNSARLTGSEVMGILAPNRQLAPTVDSLQIRKPSRLRHSRYAVLLTIYHSKLKMSNVFFVPESIIFFAAFAKRCGKQKKIDKRKKV